MAEALFMFILLFQKEDGMKVIGVIPARYASSRFPGKPLADIHGHPMIWWVYQQTKQVAELDEVIVATDDERIANEVRAFGGKAVMTSNKHLTGTDRVAEIADMIAADVYVNVQGDEPLIEPDTLRQLISALDDPAVEFVTLKHKITEPSEINNPNTVKIVTDQNSDALYCSRSLIPSNLKGYTGPIYRHVGIYAYRRDSLLRFIQMPQSELELSEGVELLRAIENGCKVKVRDSTFSSLGVDTPQDLEKVRDLITRQRNSSGRY
jgi:3-deoxy-manno-octulosonate cytidylyltransferase (CMP-KDO synthetase)